MTFLNYWMGELGEFFTRKHLANLAIALIIFLIGHFLARRASNAISRLPQLDTQQKILATKAVYYGLFFFTLAAALSQLGFDLRVLLGAAGVLTVAIGFAAQTSASNLISGLFLMIERPFVVGNVISIGDIRGEVMSIDFLSSKIRTFNNLMVRISNESLMRSNIINYSYFPIRRLDFNIAIAADVDFEKLKNLIVRTAVSHPLCLEDPKPVFLFTGLDGGATQLQFQVWATTDNIVALQNELYAGLKQNLQEAGLNAPTAVKTLTMAPLQPANPSPPAEASV